MQTIGAVGPENSIDRILEVAGSMDRLKQN